MVDTHRTTRCRPFASLPFIERNLPGVPLPPLIVAVGETGAAVLDRIGAARLHHGHGFVRAPYDAKAFETAHRGLQRTIRLGGELPCHDRIEVVVVGSPRDLSGNLGPIVREVGQLAALQGRTASVVAFEVGDGPIGDVDSTVEPVVELARRFRIAAHYNHATLAHEEQIELVARVFGGPALGALFRFLDHHQPEGTVLVGAALGWRPDVPVQQALARHLRRALARDVVAGAPRATKGRGERSPSWSAPLADLHQTLNIELSREFEELAGRLRTDLRRQPIPELEQEPPAGHETALKCVLAWVNRAGKELRWSTAARLVEAGGVHRAGTVLEALVEDLDRRREVSSVKARALEAARSRAARALRDTDGRRVAAMLPRLATWRTRRRLRRFARARVAELSARYIGQALAQVRPILEELAAGLAQFEDEARFEARRTLDDLFEPDHPNQIALLEPESLEQFLEWEARRLARTPTAEVFALLWRRLAPELVKPSTPAGRWNAVEHAALELAAGLDGGVSPLGSVCRARVADRYRPESLREFLVRLSQPRSKPEAGPPAIESHAASALDPSGRDSPFVLTFHWRDGQRRER